MIGKIHLFVFIYLCGFHGISQTFVWTKKNRAPAPHIGLACDKAGFIYDYGNNLNSVLSYPDANNPDTVGTYIQKFSSTGELYKTIRWKIPFYISKLIYDGDVSFYFTGCFRGNINISGKNLNSQGSYDGMFGKMDLDGNLLWINTLGGKGRDKLNDICLDAKTKSLFITGNADTLFINGKFISIGSKKSILVIQCSTEGVLQNTKRFGFDNDEENPGNEGLEIKTDKNGNVFLAGMRNGKKTASRGNASAAGLYVWKLNENLDTLWSRFIIGPECYYGKKYGSLRIMDNGDACIHRFCAQKYGGAGEIVRLNNSDGEIKWTYGKQCQKGYEDIYTERNILFLIGNEGANIGPSPECNQGYTVIKTFDEKEELLTEVRLQKAELKNIISDAYGNVYVAGEFSEPFAVIGNEVVPGDSLMHGVLPYYFTTFISRLSYKNRNMETGLQLNKSKSEPNYSIYPNPAKNTIYIGFPSDCKYKVRVRDITSHIIEEKEFNEKNASLNISKLSTGVYFIGIEKDGKETSYKFIKQAQ